MLNVAPSSKQAQRAFFQPMVRAVERKGSWFNGRCAPTQQSIMYEKNVEAITGHSDADTQEGLNLILGVADEIAAFKTKDEIEQQRSAGPREPTNSSEGVLRMLLTSARTRFPEVFKNVAISYPRFKGDAIQQLTARGVEDNKLLGVKSRIYTSGPLPTWEVNPRVTSKESFREDYDADPAMARAMYECKPELAVNRFFRNDTAVYAAFSELRDPQPIEISYSWKIADRDRVILEALPGDQEFSLSQPGWQVSFDIDRNLRPIQGAQYALHGDIGITSDRAGIAMAHVRQFEERQWVGSSEDGADVAVQESRPIVKLDFVTAFSADIAAKPMPREVQIRWYRDE